MKKPEVITVPNPKLYEATEKIASFDNDLKLQLQNMIKILRKEGGIGLAANQLGYQNRVVIAEFHDKESKEKIPLSIFVNPEIVDYSNQKECLEEGCLSVPKIELEIDRPTKIKIKFQDKDGHKLKSAPKGLLARILQHEVDHLNGIIFTQHAKEQFLVKYPEFKNYRIVFFGSGQFGAIILEGLILLGLNLDIYTEQSKPAGRDRLTKQTPVAQVAKKFGKKYHEISNFEFQISNFDLIICADFGQKIPDSVLKTAKTCLPARQVTAINIHPSLLPKYIGPSPIQAAILNGDKSTGVSIIKMTDKIDEGPIYSQIETDIDQNESYILLRDRLATLGLKLLIKTLAQITSDKLELIHQDLSKAKRTRKFTKADGKIDWQKSAKKIDAQIRAFTPWPSSYALIDGKRLIIHSAHLEKSPDLSSKFSKLHLDIVQIEGKKPMKFADFLRGFHGQKPDWFEKISK